jgi:polyphosphate kinase
MSLPPTLNRELSWLEFNRRVLEMAMDARTPLLERVRFLDIFSSNLDEFFMKRVGGLKRQVMAKAIAAGADPWTPPEQLAEIRVRVLQMLDEIAGCFRTEIEPELEKHQIHLVRAVELTQDEKSFANEFFFRNIFPVLTPLYVDPGHPFPFISNLSTSFAVLMRRPGKENEELFARVKIPSVFSPWVALPGGERFVSLHEIIGSHLDALFPGMEVIDVLAFRLTRNADIERDEEDAEDLLEMVAEELRERRFARAVRLEHSPHPNAQGKKMLAILMDEMGLEDEDLYEFPLHLEYASLAAIADLARPALKYPPWSPVVPGCFADPEANIFDVIAAGDQLVHHPYESFNASVERFLRGAVEDRKVIAVKMTLYRTGDSSPFIPLLIRAAEAGKQVVCLVELKARFDEERNILVAQELEKAGVHVVYGIVGLKTHCKISLVVRQEGQGVRSYAHIGTGNYHARTARLYTDFGLFTANAEIVDDVVHLFHYLTGHSLQWRFNRLLVAPVSLRSSFVAKIENEIRIARGGGRGRIIAKMNSLQDRAIILLLYEASAAGVEIDLLVRGVCCLRPGVAGLSERIRVVSVVGRFLEHSRVFYFGCGAAAEGQEGGGEYFIGSADWMERNLDARVEAIVPVEDPASKRKLWNVLRRLLEDPEQGWEMRGDGSYERRNSSLATPTAPTTLALANEGGDLPKEVRGAPGAQGEFMRQAIADGTSHSLLNPPD